MKRKKEFIIVLISLLVIVLSVSVAYFTIRILGTGKEISVDFADLKVIFTSGNGTINGNNIKPGWTSGENTFTVKNESNGTYKYNIVIKDLVNTTVTNNSLVYKITSTDGGYNMTEFLDVPKSEIANDKVIAYNITIEKGVTHTYTIVVNYNNDDNIDQSADIGKKLNGKLFIAEGTEKPKLVDKLLEDNPSVKTRTDFSTPFTTNTANTVYKSTENGTDVYYFAGQDTVSTPINNWVKFGKYQNDYIRYRGVMSASSNYYAEYSTLEECNNSTSYNYNCSPYKYASAGDDMYWRIIRTNSDGSIRLLYSGTSPDTTTGHIGESVFNSDSTSSKYVGYMYGDSDTTLEEARTNTNDSAIKTYIDNWYENNLTSYTNYLSNDAIYCNDRELANGSTYDSSTFYFKQYERIVRKKTPTYDCTNSKDAFSVNNTEAKLKYPIALLTIDEVMFAGGANNQISIMWYYTNSNNDTYVGIIKNGMFTMSPDSKRNNISYMAVIGGPKVPTLIMAFSTNTKNENVRPVISLKNCTLWNAGNGTPNNPYIITENNGC